MYLFASQELTLDEGISKSGELSSSFFWLVSCVVIPVFTLFEALKSQEVP